MQMRCWFPRRLRFLCIVLMGLGSCQTAERGGFASADRIHRTGDPQRSRRRSLPPIGDLFCLYDQRPWFSADAAGDRDPEGIQYRIFLRPRSTNGAWQGVLREGTFHIEMYAINRSSQGEIVRDLVSDWHYPTDAFTTIESKILGRGYRVKLRWAAKEIAGREIEIITEYESPDGRRVRSSNKRFPVPKYVS